MTSDFVAEDAPTDDEMWSPVFWINEDLGVPLYWWQDTVVSWFEDSRGPVRGSLCTPNGAGKSSNIVGPLALWWLGLHEKGRVVITTKDGKQLVNQVWEAIERHRSKFPDWSFLKSERKVENGTGGWILGFTTDEPGRAEGWHKLNDEDGPLLIIVDEAKSVQENIFNAIDRCTFNALLYTSSPGLKSGTFYRSVTDPRMGFKALKVGLKDCPHIPQHRIDAVVAKYGPDHPFTLSTLHGEFMDEDESTRFIVPPSSLRLLLDNPPPYSHGDKVAFCDFAAGGDENVLAVKTGNRVEIQAAWREVNTMAACGRFVVEFQRVGLRPSDIYGDNSGLGKVMIDRLTEMGWPINRVDNGSSPRDSAYYNRGAEIWFTGSEVIQTMNCILPDDEALHAQLTTRQVVMTSDGILKIEEKKDMKKRGLPSPDRADAVLGCLAVDVAMASTFFEVSGMKLLEKMARESTPEHGNIEASGATLAYNATSASPWLDVWERPTAGLSYLAVLSPPRHDSPNQDHAFFIVRAGYPVPREPARKTRIVCRLSLPCRWDAQPLADMVSRVVRWYGNPLTIPIVNDRGDIIQALRAAGVTISVRRDFERLKRGAQSNAIEYGWESNKFTRSMWIGDLADAIRNQTIEIEDVDCVMELFALSSDNSDQLRRAEAIGVALNQLTYASKNEPAPVNILNPADELDQSNRGWAQMRKGANRLAIS